MSPSKRKKSRSKTNKSQASWGSRLLGGLLALLVLLVAAALSLWIFLPQMISLEQSQSLVFFQLDQNQDLTNAFYLSFNPVFNQVSVQPFRPEFEASFYYGRERKTKAIKEWWQQYRQHQPDFLQNKSSASFFSYTLSMPITRAEEIDSSRDLSSKKQLLAVLWKQGVEDFELALNDKLRLYFFARQANFVTRDEAEDVFQLLYMRESLVDCPVAIINPTELSGLANYHAQILTNGGGKIVRVASPSFSQDELQEKWSLNDKTQVLVKDQSQCRQTIELIGQTLRAKPEINKYTPELDYWFNRYRANLVIILGEDQDWKFD